MIHLSTKITWIFNFITSLHKSCDDVWMDGITIRSEVWFDLENDDDVIIRLEAIRALRMVIWVCCAPKCIAVIILLILLPGFLGGHLPVVVMRHSSQLLVCLCCISRVMTVIPPRLSSTSSLLRHFPKNSHPLCLSLSLSPSDSKNANSLFSKSAGRLCQML